MRDNNGKVGAVVFPTLLFQRLQVQGFNFYSPIRLPKYRLNQLLCQRIKTGTKGCRLCVAGCVKWVAKDCPCPVSFPA
jgi:hypothetical protein